MANSTSVLPPEARRLEGKVALITGGASGIGEHMAILFSQHGAKIVVADIQDELGISVTNVIGLFNCMYVHCDVTNEDHVKDDVDKAVAIYGKLDIMINNAGICGQSEPRITENDKSNFERVLSVNITGVFLGMKHAARVMIPARSGTIISTGSIASSIGGSGSHAYTSSKHAVVGLTKNLAVELGEFGIRVNCVSPYGLATPMTTSLIGLDDKAVERSMNTRANLKGVTLTTTDVANATLFLASDEAKYVSGQNLSIDGGFGITNGAIKMFEYPEIKH